MNGDSLHRRDFLLHLACLIAITLLATACAGSTPPATIEPTPQPTATTPASTLSELLQELNQTTLVADREATLAVIERIEAHAPETAASLHTLVENFQMGRIRELVKDVETEYGSS